MMRLDGNWALGADALQWILQRRHANGWRAVAFVSSNKDILARVMREEGVSPLAAKEALDRLPDTFRECAASPYGPFLVGKTASPIPDTALPPKIADKTRIARMRL